MARRVVDQQGRRLGTATGAGRLHAERHKRLRQGGLARGGHPVCRVRRVRHTQGRPSEGHGQVPGAKGRLVPGSRQTVVAETRSESLASVRHRRPHRLQPETVHVETG